MSHRPGVPHEDGPVRVADEEVPLQSLPHRQASVGPLTKTLTETIFYEHVGPHVRIFETCLILISLLGSMLLASIILSINQRVAFGLSVCVRGVCPRPSPGIILRGVRLPIGRHGFRWLLGPQQLLGRFQLEGWVGGSEWKMIGRVPYNIISRDETLRYAFLELEWKSSLYFGIAFYLLINL